jgi:hypothetical protein
MTAAQRAEGTNPGSKIEISSLSPPLYRVGERVCALALLSRDAYPRLTRKTVPKTRITPASRAGSNRFAHSECDRSQDDHSRSDSSHNGRLERARRRRHARLQVVTCAFSAFFGHLTTSNVGKCPKDAGEPVLLASPARLRHPQRDGGRAPTTQGGIRQPATHVCHRPRGADHTGPAARPPERTFATGPRTVSIFSTACWIREGV